MIRSQFIFTSSTFYIDEKGIHFNEAEITREDKIFREAVLQAMQLFPNYSRFNAKAGFIQFFCYKDGGGKVHYIQHYKDGVDYDCNRVKNDLLMEKIQKDPAYREIRTFYVQGKSLYLIMALFQQEHAYLRS